MKGPLERAADYEVAADVLIEAATRACGAIGTLDRGDEANGVGSLERGKVLGLCDHAEGLANTFRFKARSIKRASVSELGLCGAQNAWQIPDVCTHPRDHDGSHTWERV